jgi:hypothetical protein
MRDAMERRTLWDSNPVLAGIVVIVAIGAGLLVLNRFVLPEIDHLAALAAAATKRWMSQS